MDTLRLHYNYEDGGDRLRFIIDPTTGADNWANSAGGAQQKYTTGVQNTTKDVVGNAIAQQNVMVSNFNQSVTSGRWASRLSAVGNSGWKTSTVAKASNYGTGIAAAKSKYLAAAQKLYPYIAQGQAMIAAMPKGTLADSKARATAMIDYMAAYKAQA